jgi:adenylate cyclase
MSTNLEIERKFVVNTNHPEWQKICGRFAWQRLIQSTIHKESGYKLRVRMIEDITTGLRKSFFCFKVSKEKNKKTDPAVRDEYEWPVQDRNALYMMIGHGEISKIRREWTDENWLHFAADEYEWVNAWIVTLDVEIPEENHSFQKPEWCGWEVTADERLKNSTLQEERNAYIHWTKEQKEWYTSLQKGDGVSIYPTESVWKKEKKKSLWKRIKRAYRIIRGKEE